MESQGSTLLVEGRSLESAVIGTIRGWTDDGRPLVEFHNDDATESAPARTTVQLMPEDAGREVTLLFERGDTTRPIVIGLLQDPERADTESSLPENAEIDGERITLTGKREIVLRCGKASITLTRAGKILIRGAYLLNRSSGVNRIKGGSVQIN